MFSASLLFSQQNPPPFYSWHNQNFHINTFIHFIHVVKQMHKMSGKYLNKKYKISFKKYFFYFLYHFQGQFSIMELRNAILQYNTLSMMCILVTGLKWRPQGGTQNKQRACVKPCSVTRDRRHATRDSRHILSFVARQKINVCSVTCDTINSFHTKMTSIELLLDELIIASAAFIMYQYSENQKENGDGSSTLYINKDRHVGHLCHLAEWVVSLWRNV